VNESSQLHHDGNSGLEGIDSDGWYQPRFRPSCSTRFTAQITVRIGRGFWPPTLRRSHDRQPWRERPPNPLWGQGPGSAGGVAHVPAALLHPSAARRSTPCCRQRSEATRRLSATQTCCRRNP